MMAEDAKFAQSLAALLDGLVPFSTNLLADIEVAGVALDSRQVKDNFLFMALKGYEQDAVRYVRGAIQSGAVAVLHETPLDEVTQQYIKQENIACICVPELRQIAGKIASRFYADPSRALAMVGVTGTDGKTSVTHFVAQALETLGERCGVLGTVGNGLYGKLDASMNTTPDVVSLHQMLAEFSSNAQYAAMEVSSHGLDQCRVEGVVFELAVLTNLTRDHLDYHGDVAAYKNAKKKLFMQAELKTAILNQNDEFGRELVDQVSTGCRVIEYGIDFKPSSHCDAWVLGTGLQLNDDGISMTVSAGQQQAVVKSRLLGDFNASNVLAVIAVLLELKFEFKDIVNAIAHLKSVDGRMQSLKVENKPAVVIDYAHTPNALRSVLLALRNHCKGRLWCVFGCGGDRDQGKRPVMGGIASQFSDVVIVTDDNPRTEDADVITQQIVEGVQSEKLFGVVHDRASAIQQAIENASVEDMILIAGKGHEDYQIIGNNRLEFSDKEVASRFLMGVRQ